MNRHLKEFLRKATAIVAAVAIAAGPARGDVLLSWDFNGNSGSETTVTAGTIASNLGVGSGVISRGAGLTAGGNANRYNASGWAVTNIANAISGNDYMEFSLNFNNTHSFSIDDIAFNWQRSNSGPRELALRSSLDSYGSNIQSFTIVDNDSVQSFTATLGGATYSGLEQNVTLRFYGWAEGTTGTGGFEGSGADLVVNGTTTLLEVTPSGDPIYWDANGSTAGIGGTGTWAAASALFSTTEAGTDATTRADANPLIFGGTAGTVTVTDTVNANAGLSFATTGYSLTGGTVSLGGADAAANTITTAAATATAIDSLITGSTGLTKAGGGALTLSAANTYSGGTIVSAGSLIGTTSSLQGAITNSAAVTFDQATDGTYAGIMSGSGSLTKVGEGNVTLSGANTYSGGTTVSAGSLVGTSSSLQGAITNNAAVTFDQAAYGTYAGIMSGSGSLSKLGAGNVTLGGANTYSGGTTVSGGSLAGTSSSLQGTITNNAAVIFDQATVGTYAGIMSGSGSLTKSGAGNLTLSAANTYSGGTTVSAGALTGSTSSLQGAIVNNAAVVFAQASDGTYSGAMSGSGTLTKSGSGSVTLSGNNSFSGGTTLSGGTLVAAANDAFGSGTVAASSGTLLAGAGIDVSNTMTLTPGSAINDAWINEFHYDNTGADVGEFVEVFVGSGFQAGSFNAELLRIDLYNGGDGASYQNSDISGTVAATSITGGTMYVWTGMTNGIQNGAPDGLVVTYNGTVIAQGLLSYEGTMTGVGGVAVGLGSTDVGASEAGTEAVGQSLKLTGSGSAFNDFTWAGPSADSPGAVNAGQTITAGGPITIGSDIGSGTATFSGGITLNGNVSATAAAGGITAFSGNITGSGGIDKVGAGTVVLSGVNTYSGGTTINGGTLSVAADENLGDSSGGITLGGGTLELTSGFTLGSGRTVTAAASTTSRLAVTSGTVSYGGAFAGSGGLDKAGAGQLTLGNASTGYTGSFTISAGTVELTAANAFANATVTQTGGTLLLNPAGGGTDVDVPDFGGEGGEVSVASGKKANFGGSGDRAYRGQIRGQGGLKKSGNGRLTLDQDNDFAGATEVTAGILEIAAGGALSETSAVSIATGGRLLLNGRVGRNGNTASVSVGSGGILAGSGQVFGTVGGAGSVGPGNSPGILEATATDPSGGLDYEFEFTNLSPDYSNAAASVNDLFRLTDTSSPFSGSQLGAGNVIDLYFNDGSFAEGRTYTGGFFLDATAGGFASFLDAIDSATVNVFVADASGGVSYEGNSYLSLADYNTANSLGLSVSLGVSTIPSANFSGGTVTNGQAMQAVVVPEPDAFLLGGLGLAFAAWASRRRQRPAAA